MPEKDWGTPAHKIPEKDSRGFYDVFPSPTRGDGKLRPNNVRSGGAQGKGGSKKKVRCSQCGFLVDISKVDHSGGSSDGNGAGGAITETSETGTLSNGGSYTEVHGAQAHNKGSGCPFCFSKNSTKVRNFVQSPTPRPMNGL